MPNPDYLAVDAVVIGASYHGRDVGNLSEPIKIVIKYVNLLLVRTQSLLVE